VTAERVGQREHWGKMVPQEQEETRENPEILDLRDPWDFKGHLVQPVPQGHQEHRAQEEHEDCQVQLVSLVFPVSQENQEILELRESGVIKEDPVLLAHPESEDLLVKPVPTERPVNLAFVAKPEMTD